jgi:hypothetical protein
MTGKFRCSEFALERSQLSDTPRLVLVPHAPTPEDAAAKKNCRIAMAMYA